MRDIRSVLREKCCSASLCGIIMLYQFEEEHFGMRSSPELLISRALRSAFQDGVFESVQEHLKGCRVDVLGE